MLTADTIVALLAALNDELKAKGVKGEVGLCGGAVMCLVFKSRVATKDVDGVFEPTREIREACAKVAGRFDVPRNWLNDAAKGFFAADPPRVDVLSYSHLQVWAPTAEYMLAMKCVSARFDSYDKDDVVFLIERLRLRSPQEVFAIIARYYPSERVPAKTRFLVEELLEGSQAEPED